MTGNNYNKQSGQILLIMIMLVGVLLTVVLSVTFTSRTETQLTKLEEENQKALAAAEAGIEAALKQGISGTVAIESLGLGGGFTGTATISQTTGSAFVTPLLQKDQEYTVYLSVPSGPPENPDFSSLSSQYNNSMLTLCSTSDSFALEVTFIKVGGGLARYAINPRGSEMIVGGTASNDNGSCPQGETFPYKHQLSQAQVGANNLLLVIRIVGQGSGVKVGVQGGVNLPLQGKTIVSEASSPTGVKKRVQLFQSYPQIPSDFFVTSF